MILRRVFIFLSLATATARAADEPSLRWVDGATLRVEGKGWNDTASPFDRLPARAAGVVRGPVYSLGRDTAGITVRFETDTASLSVRWKLRRKRIAMSHMAATGVSGLDLYARIGGVWRWVAVARPEKSGRNEAVLFAHQQTASREFMLYLPLYNGIEELELGVGKSAALTSPPAQTRRPLVFYGTSAVQGGCASRPGMAYPAIVGRRLGWPALNLGFSGNGKAEPEMAALLGELDPAAYIIDCVPNLEPEETARVEAFVHALRTRHASTPILLVENLAYPDGVLLRERQARHLASNRILREIHTRLHAEDPDLYYLEAGRLLDAEGEGTVDGSHPTDLGFTRMAEAMISVLRPLLPDSPGKASTPIAR